MHQHVQRRVVQQTGGERVSLNTPPNNNTAFKVNQETWPSRFAAITSTEGYDTGRQIIRATPIDEWLEFAQKKPAYWFIDGSFLYTAMQDQDLYLDFSKIAGQHIVQPIHYFSLFSPDNTGVHRLFSLLNSLGYKMFTKQQVRIDYEKLHGNARTIAKYIESRAILNSVAPEMIVQMMEAAWDGDQSPEMEHALIISPNPQLVPAIVQLRKLGISVTGVVAPSQTMINFYLAQFTHLISVTDLFRSMGAVANRLSSTIRA